MWRAQDQTPRHPLERCHARAIKSQSIAKRVTRISQAPPDGSLPRSRPGMRRVNTPEENNVTCRWVWEAETDIRGAPSSVAP
jgi:hypothetical protein